MASSIKVVSSLQNIYAFLQAVPHEYGNVTVEKKHHWNAYVFFIGWSENSFPKGISLDHACWFWGSYRALQAAKNLLSWFCKSNAA
jgi:hypothetical protein